MFLLCLFEINNIHILVTHSPYDTFFSPKFLIMNRSHKNPMSRFFSPNLVNGINESSIHMDDLDTIFDSFIPDYQLPTNDGFHNTNILTDCMVIENLLILI